MTTTTNYFRSAHGTFFFDHMHLATVETAYQAATQEGEIACVYRAFPCRSTHSWFKMDLVGFLACEPLRRRINQAKREGESTLLYEARLREREEEIIREWSSVGAS